MSTVVETIKAGICGFTTTINAKADDDASVQFEVDSDCPNIKALAEVLPEVDAYTEVGAGFEGELWTTIRSSLKGCCSGCVVPVGLFKAMQVAAGLALPADVSLSFQKK